MPELFVSYSRDDSALTEPLAENLRKLGFDLWIDIEHLAPGTPAWTRAIDDALHRADGILAFLSPTAKASNWCEIETMRAQMYEKPIYPILLSGDARTAVPIHLTGAQYADMRGRVNREKEFDTLIQTLAKDFNHTLPDFDTESSRADGMPVINITVTGHLEGSINPLVVTGDVHGDVLQAGRNIEHSKQAPAEAPPPEPTFDALTVYREAIAARGEEKHNHAIDLLRQIQTHASDLFPEQVANLISDSEAKLEQKARYKAYLRAYQEVEILSLDPVTIDDARSLWEELRDAYPDIDYDPEGLTETLRPVFEHDVNVWILPELALPKRRQPVAEFVAEPEPPDIFGLLPQPFEWCKIPGKQGFSLDTDDGHKGTYDITSFFMAKYQTTQEQFQIFINAGDGFNNDQWWDGLAKREIEPGEQYFTHTQNLPRDTVSWYDAIAFCRWLSWKLGYEIRLPTEWEWQWAAQGDDGRSYPWGHHYVQGYANIDEKTSRIKNGIYLEKTTPVGSYIQGASPYGMLDMSGNVWEWCLNEYKSPAQISTFSDARRVLRGGSWAHGDFSARVDLRYPGFANFRNLNHGFRVVSFAP